MSAWAWVTLAYAVTYLGLGAYAFSIAYRIRQTRERLGELQ